MTNFRTRVDTGWTLVAIYSVYFVAILPAHRLVWARLASGEPGGLGIFNSSVLALFATTVGVVALSAYLAPAATERLTTRLSKWLHQSMGHALPILITLALAIPALIAYFVLDRFPNSGDEFAYFFQANLFAKGRLWAEAPPLGYTFVPYRTWIIGDKWLSQYPPGWPLAMAAAITASIPAWLLNALLGGAGVASFLSPLWQFRSRVGALAAAGIFVLTPFYILNAASFHSHMLSAILILLLCLCCLWFRRDHNFVALMAAGALLGLIGLTRYFTLILVIPALCYWIFVENRRDRLWMIGVLGLAGMPFLGLLLTYQYLVTGSPFRSTYALIAAKDVFISFSPVAILHGAKLTIHRIIDLGIWASPIVLVAYLFCLVIKLKHRTLVFYDLIFPSVVVGYIFFPDLGVNRYGPRYYFDAFPLMLVTIVSAAPEAAASARRLFNRPVAAHAVLVCAIYLMAAFPFAVPAYYQQVQSRQEPYRLAAAKKLTNAIVIVKTSSGIGLMAQDLARNDFALNADVLYARAKAVPEELRRIFPGRSIWIYERDGPQQPGRLEFVQP